MKTGLNLRIRENLKALGFAHTLANIDNILRNARESGSDYEEFLLALTDEELQIRDENRLKRKLRDARFPLLKTLEMLDYEAVPELDRRLVRELETGAYIGIRVNQSHCYRCGFNLVRRCSKDGLEGFRSWVTGRDLCDQHKPYAGRGGKCISRLRHRQERTPISISGCRDRADHERHIRHFRNNRRPQ